MSEPVHIRQVSDLRRSVAKVRLMEAVLSKELSVALLIRKQLPSFHPIVDTTLTVNAERQCIDVLVTYQNRTPATKMHSIPFDKLSGEEIKFLFDCSNISEEVTD